MKTETKEELRKELEFAENQILMLNEQLEKRDLHIWQLIEECKRATRCNYCQNNQQPPL